MTQPFHAKRAAHLFRAAGLTPRAWHLVGNAEDRDPRRAVRWYVREYGAWLKVLATRARRRP